MTRSVSFGVLLVNYNYNLLPLLMWRPRLTNRDSSALLAEAGEVVEEAGIDEDVYWAAAVSYELNDYPGLSDSIIDAVFLRVSEGRIPPELEDDTTVFLGVVVGE